MKIKGLILLGVLLLLGTFGCSKGEEASAGSANRAESMSAQAPSMDLAVSSPEGPGKAAMPPRDEAINIEATKRYVVRNGNMTVRVDDVHKSLKQLKKLVQDVRGFTQNEASTDMESQIPHASITIRIPVDRLDSFMDQVETIGTLRSRDVKSDDVTTSVVDMDSRVKTMLAREEAYRQILRQCRKIADVMTVQQNLTQIRTEIESIQAQLKSLREQAAYSTLTVTLEQSATTYARTAEKGWLEETWANAVGSLKQGLKTLAQHGIWLVVMAPFWLIPLIILIWLIRAGARKMRPTESNDSTPPPVQ